MSTETSSLPDLTRLRETAGRVRRWLDKAAWPLWIEQGIDSDGLFYEQLDFAGRPDLSARRRVRVQGRQLFCFALARASGQPVHLMSGATGQGVPEMLRALQDAITAHRALGR